jgi:hypothetical protein
MRHSAKYYTIQQDDEIAFISSVDAQAYLMANYYEYEDASNTAKEFIEDSIEAYDFSDLNKEQQEYLTLSVD